MQAMMVVNITAILIILTIAYTIVLTGTKKENLFILFSYCVYVTTVLTGKKKENLFILFNYCV
jgi:hypothetical protein